MAITKLCIPKLCLAFSLLIASGSLVPGFAINSEPYVCTVLFDPGPGKMLYLAYVGGDEAVGLHMMTFNGSLWSPMLNDIPDPQRAPYSPAMAVFQDKLWVASIAHPTVNPQPVLFNAYNGSSWEEPMLAPNYTIGAIKPAIASYQYEGQLRTYYWLFLFWQTPENDIYGTAYEAIDGWSNEPFPIANETVAEIEPAATVYGQLFVAWVSNGTILCKTFNGVSWNPAINPEPYLTPRDPSLAVHENVLYLGYEAESNIYIQAFNGSTWTTGHELINPQPTPYDPAICSYSGSSLLYLVYVSEDQIYHQTYDGADWSSPILIIPEFNGVFALPLIITTSALVILIAKGIAKKRSP